MTTSASGTERLPAWRLALYAAPGLPILMTHVPANSILPALYASHANISLVTIGLIIFAAKVLDAFTDPLMGMLSDRTRSTFGRRKPWMALGTLLLCVCVSFLYAIPDGATAVYFTIWYVLTFQSWTMIEIPYRAWGIELSRDYAERSRIATYLAMSWAVGGFLFLLLTFLPIFGSAKIDTTFLRWVMWPIIGALLVMVPLACAFVPNGPTVETKPESFKRLVRSLRDNKPLWIFIAIFVLGGLGGGIVSSLVFLYATSLLKIPDKFSLLMLVYGLLNVVATPMYLRAVKLWGKHRTWAASWVVSAAAIPFIAFIEPGPGAFVPFLVILSVRAVASAADNAIPMALFGDVVDYDVLKTGTDRTANYVALMTLVLKFNQAIGTALGFFLLGLVGYNAAGNNTPEAEWAFTMLYSFVPPVLYLAACALLWKFPIDARRHGVIRRRIEQRAERARRANAGPQADGALNTLVPQPGVSP